MKRRIIALLLIAALCLGLCACGKEVPAEQLAVLYGTWYCPDPVAVTETGMPGYLVFTEDGQCTYNDQGGYTWTAKVSKDSEDIVDVTIKSDSKEKHTFTMWLGDPNYVDASLTMGEEGPYMNYMKVNTAIEASWAEDVMIEWFSRGEADNLVESASFNADGTCKIGTEDYFWSKPYSESGNSEDYFHIEAFNADGLAFYVDFSKGSNGINDMSLQECAGGDWTWGGSYYPHAMLKQLNEGGSWESFDRNTMIEYYFYVSPWSSTAGIADVEHDVVFDTKAAADSLTVNFMEGSTARYTAKIVMEDVYPMLTLTDNQSGQETLYYNNGFGYAEGHPDAAYYQVIDMAYDAANDYGVYKEETDEYLYDDEALSYIYEKLQALGDYKQTQEFLDRFTIVPSVLTKVTRYTKDQLNNVSESWMNEYQYDENGTLIAARGEEIFELYGMDEDWSWQYFTYDDSGKLTMIEVKSGDTIYAVGTPTYDAAGNMISMDVQTTSGSYTTTFIYDDQGNRILMAMPESYYDEPRTIAYTYDDQGRLATKTETWNGGNYSDISTYGYSNKGISSINTVHMYRGNEDYVTTYAYTNDDQGRPVTITVTTTDDVTYRSRNLEYTYEDLYFFDNTGLVYEEE